MSPDSTPVCFFAVLLVSAFRAWPNFPHSLPQSNGPFIMPQQGPMFLLLTHHGACAVSREPFSCLPQCTFSSLKSPFQSSLPTAGLGEQHPSPPNISLSLWSSTAMPFPTWKSEGKIKKDPFITRQAQHPRMKPSPFTVFLTALSCLHSLSNYGKYPLQRTIFLFPHITTNSFRQEQSVLDSVPLATFA